MKKQIVILLCICLCVGTLNACGKTGANTGNSSIKNEANTDSEQIEGNVTDSEENTEVVDTQTTETQMPETDSSTQESTQESIETPPSQEPETDSSIQESTQESIETPPSQEPETDSSIQESTQESIETPPSREPETDSSIQESTQKPAETPPPQEPENNEQESEPSNPYGDMTEEEYKEFIDKLYYEKVPDMDLYRKKVQWVRENYGDTITCEEIVFTYDEATSDYIIKEFVKKIHVMTSPSTSEVKYMYETRYRLPEYLGYYGTEHPLYDTVRAFDYIENLYYEEFPNAQEITENYLLQLGFTSTIPQSDKYKDFSSPESVDGVEFWSPEGVPVSLVMYDGFILLRVSYPDNRKVSTYDFTIEEYNEFVSTYTSFEVREQRYLISWMDGPYEESIHKYIYIP